MNLHLSLKLIIGALFVGAALNAAAQETSDDGDEETPLVQVELPQDNLAPYVERRDTSGYYFGMTYEALELKNYVSVLDNTNVQYANAFGSKAIALISLSGDYKYNTSLGSFAAGLNFGIGEVADNKSGVDRKLSVTKYGVGFKLTLDTLWPEPYVAPYVGLNLWQLGIKDTSPTDSFSMTTQMGYNYVLGLLFQLDWLDYSASKTSTFDWGVENTFLDIYATQYAKTSSEEDPDTATDFIYGAGVRVEF